MKLIQFQAEYIEEIIMTSVKLLRDEFREHSSVIFKAPTGSGKTYMISKALSGILKEQETIASYSIIWLSVNSLHEQSRVSLNSYFKNECNIDCLTIEEFQNNRIEENEILFVNWDSLIKNNNIFRMDNERNWNLSSVVENTKDEGHDIIVIIDESHRTASAAKAKEVLDEIKPKLIIEMTATPSQIQGVLIEIPLARVIAEGMIKKEVLVNPGCASIKENKDLLRLALAKRLELKKAFESLAKEINPLLLIQIPNKKQTDSTNPEDYIVELLAENKITEQNGKLAIRLSGVDIKELDETVKPNESQVEVLIFKEAIALGWDCPRAMILFLQREWKQERYSFNIQTLGRIMRMPEQMHYQNNPELNVGYVYSASDNFEIVQELASDYVSTLNMSRDEDLYIKPVRLTSEFIRRKRELTRLSGDFKQCLVDAASQLKLEEEINIHVKQIEKTVAIDGLTADIDKERKQEIIFENTKQINKDTKEIADSYGNFCSEMSYPYSKARSTNILKSSLRSLFKEKFSISDEDKIALIVMHRNNNGVFKRLLEEAKENYKKLPPKEEEIVSNPNWEIPQSISLFTNYTKIDKSYKSIIKESELRKLFVKKNLNGKLDLSKPELDFITSLEATDDDVLWWFKNGVKESKYFGIAYKKSDGYHYGFYPDFLIKTKKEVLIVEIKDDRDFKPENLLKLNAGKDYVTRTQYQETIRFFMLSPIDFSKFFYALKDLELDHFSSLYEERLIRYNQSQKTLLEHSGEKSAIDEENQILESELEKTIKQLQDEKLKNELIQMELITAKENLDALSRSVNPLGVKKNQESNLKLKTPFNICVLGEVTETEILMRELNLYFSKLGISSTQWHLEVFSNTKLQNRDVLKSLRLGQTKFDLIVTGQIFHHSLQGNKRANIFSELASGKYINSLKGCEPQEMLTPNKLINALDSYFRENYGL